MNRAMEELSTEVTTLSDDCVKVTISRGGLHLTATVSSMHLVPDKEAQLKRLFPLYEDPTVRDSRCAEGGVPGAEGRA